jgi:meiotically up-regulated gene 157 (Mug157) protein
MLWNNLMCLDFLNLKTLLWKVWSSKTNNLTFDFIKILAQIINIFSRTQQNEK